MKDTTRDLLQKKLHELETQVLKGDINELVTNALDLNTETGELLITTGGPHLLINFKEDEIYGAWNTQNKTININCYRIRDELEAYGYEV